MPTNEYHDGSVGKPTKDPSLSKRMAAAWIRMHGSNVERKEFNAGDQPTRRALIRGIPCQFCGHGYYQHALSVGQPTVYTQDHQKRVLTKYVEIEHLQCMTCAEGKKTTRVDCYSETIGIGELLRPDQTSVEFGRR